MANFSFTTNGAKPNAAGSIISNFSKPSPVASALNAMQNKPAIPAQPAPTAPIKKMTVTHPDGTKVETTHDTGNSTTTGTTPGLLNTTPNKQTGTTSDGTPIITGTFAPGSPQNQGGNASNNTNPAEPTSQYTTPSGTTVDANGNTINLGNGIMATQDAGSANTAASNNGSGTNFPGLVGSAAASANQNAAIGQSAADIAKSYGQRIADTGEQGAKAQAGYLTTGTSPVGEGNAAVQAQSTAAQQSALASGESAALQGTGQQLSAQGQQTQGLLGAAGVSAPQAGASFFGNPLTGGLIGNTGATNAIGGNSLVGSASTGNSLVDTSVENALNQIKNGSSTNDAMSVLQGGAAGQQAFLNAMKQYDPNWSITSSNAIASQNMSQGAKYQAQAQDLSNALQTMAPIGQKLTSFMQSAGLDENGIPLVNEKINQFNAQSNPAAVSTMNAAIQDMRSMAIQILGSQSGANPTDVTSAVNSFDFTNFTPTQLNTFFSNLNNLGNTRLSQVQSAMKAGYGNNSTTVPAAGATATDQGELQQGGANSLNGTPPLVKGLAGATASGISDIISGLAGKAGDAAAGAAAGAASGLAETVLGL